MREGELHGEIVCVLQGVGEAGAPLSVGITSTRCPDLNSFGDVQALDLSLRLGWGSSYLSILGMRAARLWQSIARGEAAAV